MGGLQEARAPARIDLAGGTVDIWPVCQLEPDALTVNLAIDRFATARVRARDDGRFVLGASDRGVVERHADADSVLRTSRLPLHREVALLAGAGTGLEIRTRSGVPAGSGLGGSSTLLVAMLAAAGESRISRSKLLTRAMNLEARVIGVPTGAQDYLSAIHGGLGAIRYGADGPVRRRIRADLDAVARRIVLVYTGEPHHSGINNWAITKAYIDGDRNVRQHMGAIAAAARELADALSAGDFDAAGDAIGAEWEARKRLAPGVTTKRIDRLGGIAASAGSQSMKVCGAGGGGCVFFWVRDGKRAAVTRALKGRGADVLRFRPAGQGVGR